MFIAVPSNASFATVCSGRLANGIKENLSLFLSPPDGDDDRSEVPEIEVSEEEQAQIEAATKQSLLTNNSGKQTVQLEKEKAMLEAMSRIAHSQRGNPDATMKWLIDWIRKNMCGNLPPLGEAAPEGNSPLGTTVGSLFSPSTRTRNAISNNNSVQRLPSQIRVSRDRDFSRRNGG